MASMRAPTTGSAGESNGIFSMISRLSAVPGMSTPSQNERSAIRLVAASARILSTRAGAVSSP